MNAYRLSVLALPLLLSACVTSTVDEMVFNAPQVELGDSTVVILGRRHSSDYETEPDFVECVADHITSGDKSLNVMPELEFMNALYPWFEPRTAPLRPSDIEKLATKPKIPTKMRVEFISISSPASV
jgi:hypothetical protein